MIDFEDVTNLIKKFNDEVVELHKQRNNYNWPSSDYMVLSDKITHASNAAYHLQRYLDCKV